MPFFVRTCLIYCLGSEYVGLNAFYSSLLTMLNLAELGFSSAIAYSMYKPIADGDKKLVIQLLNYFKKVYRIIGLVILGMGLALLPFLDFLIEGSAPADVNIQFAFLIYLAGTVSSYLLFGYRRTLLDAHQRNDVVSKVTLSISLAMYTTEIIILLAIPNFYLYALAIPTFAILQNLLTLYASNKLLPEYKEHNYLKNDLNISERKKIRERVTGVMVYKFCITARDSCDNIFISMFLGLTMVACYSNYFLITSSLLMVIEVICTAMTAPVGNSIASESKEKNFQDMRLFMFMYSMIAAVCLACLLVLYQPFMYLWVGEELMLPNEIVFLLALYFHVRIMGDIRAVYVDATGLWWHLKGRSIIEAVMNIALNFILVQIIGLPGVVIATLISMVLVNYLWGSEVVFSHYFKNKGLFTFFRDNLLYSFATLLACVAAYVVASYIPGMDIFSFVLKGFAGLGVSIVVLLLLFFATKRFRNAVSFVKVNILGR